jgi:hypothetical protein
MVPTPRGYRGWLPGDSLAEVDARGWLQHATRVRGLGVSARIRRTTWPRAPSGVLAPPGMRNRCGCASRQAGFHWGARELLGLAQSCRNRIARRHSRHETSHPTFLGGPSLACGHTAPAHKAIDAAGCGGQGHSTQSLWAVLPELEPSLHHRLNSPLTYIRLGMSPTSGWPTTPSWSAGQERRPAIRSWWHEEEARTGSDPGRYESDAPSADRSCGCGRDQRRCRRRHAHSRSDGPQPTERGVGHTGSAVARQLVRWHVDRIPPYQSVRQTQARTPPDRCQFWPGAPGVCWPTLAACHRVGPRAGAIGPEFGRPAAPGTATATHPPAETSSSCVPHVRVDATERLSCR